MNDEKGLPLYIRNSATGTCRAVRTVIDDEGFDILTAAIYEGTRTIALVPLKDYNTPFGVSGMYIVFNITRIAGKVKVCLDMQVGSEYITIYESAEVNKSGRYIYLLRPGAKDSSQPCLTEVCDLPIPPQWRIRTKGISEHTILVSYTY